MISRCVFGSESTSLLMQNTSRCTVGDTKRGNSSFTPKLQPSKNYAISINLNEGAAISFSEFCPY